MFTDCIKNSSGLTVPYFRHVTNTTHVIVFWYFLRNVFSVKTEMDFLEKWITFWYRAHLIGESKIFHACNFNEKIDYPQVIIRLWSAQKFTFTTWWPLILKILNYQNLINPSLEDLQWFQGHIQYVGITVTPLYIKLPADVYINLVRLCLKVLRCYFPKTERKWLN